MDCEEEYIDDENGKKDEISTITLQQYFAGVNQVKMVRICKPVPTEEEVLVNVKACGVNFQDVMVRYGVFHEMPKLPPLVMGFECAGEVVAVGPFVTEFKRGDRVMCTTRFGGWSEMVCVHKEQVYHIPEMMSYREAAVLIYAYLPAYLMLFHFGNLNENQTVFFHNAGGGVGVAITQLCKLVRNLTLVATASRHKHEYLNNHIHYLFDHKENYEEYTKRVIGGADLVLDCLGGENIMKGISLLKPLGKYILFGNSSFIGGDLQNIFGLKKSMTTFFQMERIDPLRLFEGNKMVMGFDLYALLFKSDLHDLVKETLDKICELYNEGKIRPVIDKVFKFHKAHEALDYLVKRKNIGKVVLDTEKDEIKNGQSELSDDTSGPDDEL